MAWLRRALLALALLWATPAAADPLDRWSAHVEEASARFGVPADWIRRVMRAESGGRTTLGGRPIVSHARFRAVCCDTSETLMLNGWLADSIVVERGAESGPSDRAQGHEPASQ